MRGNSQNEEKKEYMLFVWLLKREKKGKRETEGKRGADRSITSVFFSKLAFVK